MAQKSEIKEVIYYMDADLKSGNHLRMHLKKSLKISPNTLYVGIAHIGDYHVKRRRDFIPPPFDSKGYQDVNFGHADKFYSFLTTELMPLIENKFKITPKNQLIGHSLGGLFGVYSLNQNDNKFNRYYCLSPSIWINHYDIIKSINSNKNSYNQDKELFLAHGGLEYYNKIIQGNKMLIKTLKKHQPKLKTRFVSYKFQNHNSYVQNAILRILEK